MRYAERTIGSFVELISKDMGQHIAFTFFDRYRRRQYTYGQVANHAKRVGAYLLEQEGLRKGDKVVICAANRPEWVATLLACGLTGIILVPADVKSTAEFVGKISDATGAKLVITDRADLLAQNLAPSVKIDQLFERTSKFSTSTISQYDGYIKTDDLLEIVFTSGTTSEPKGVMLTHGNVVGNIRSLRLSLNYNPSWKFLSLLPMSHMLEQTVGCLAPLRFGCHIVYHNDRTSAQVAAIIKQERITSMVTVPAVLSGLRDKIEQGASEKGKMGSLNRVLGAAHKTPGPLKRLVASPVRSAIGSDIEVLICGGAALETKLERFFEDMGIRVVQGYGLTETSPIMACNSFEQRTPGSVGRVLAEQQLKLAQDGEILVAGENVTNGYWERPDLNDEYFEDGWYKTGDIGYIDPLGNLFITGRKKNMILSPNGMNVYPEDIESIMIAKRDIVKEVVVFQSCSDDSVRLVGVILPQDSVSIDPRALKQEFNTALAEHQKLDELVVWTDGDFPRTNTLKVKRDLVQTAIEDSALPRHNADLPTPSTNPDDELVRIVQTLNSAKNVTVNKQTKLREDLNLDSLDLAQLAFLLEQSTGKQVDEDLLGQAASVADIEGCLISNPASDSNGNKNCATLACAIRRILLPVARVIVLYCVLGVRFVCRKKPKVGDEPVIYVANHASHLDTPAVLATLPPSRRYKTVVAAAEDHFFENPSIFKRISGFLLNLFPFYRNGNFRRNLISIGEYLDNGYSVLVFPEGTRSRDGEIVEFKNGIGHIVREMNVPVVPVGLCGTHKLMPPSKKVPSRGTVKVSWGPAMRFLNETPEQVACALEKAVRSLEEDARFAVL